MELLQLLCTQSATILRPCPHVPKRNFFSLLACFQEYLHLNGPIVNDATCYSSYTRPIGGAWNLPTSVFHDMQHPTKHCFILSTAPHGNITPQQLSDECAKSFTVFTLIYKFPNSKSTLDPMEHAGTTMIHGGPTSQCTELRGSIANSLVPETTENPQSSLSMP